MADVSLTVTRRLPSFILLALSVAVLALVIALSVGIGELSIPLQTTFAAVTNKLGLTAVPLNRIHETVIWDFRLSRALVAACSGAGLAICGAVLQSLLKNALAEPYVLGVSAGASTGAVSIVVLGIGSGRCRSLWARLPGRSPRSRSSHC